MAASRGDTMALPNLDDDLNFIQALADRPNALDGLSAAQLKQKFDESGNTIKTFINDELIPALGLTTDSNSGADNIGATAITDLDGTTVQALIESVRNKLKGTTSGSSGAGFIGATTIGGLTGNTVQALLEALKVYIDNQGTAIGTNYVSKTELTNTRKLDPSANFTGSWFGISNPTFADPGIAGVVAEHTAQLADIAINIRTYGAKGDGSDDTIAIQNAINAIKAFGGGTLLIPDGIFTVSSRLLFPSNIRITGTGQLKAANGIPGFIIMGNDDTVNGNENISIDGISINGNRQAATSNTEFDFGIDLRNVQNVYVGNVYISNCGGDGIYLGKGTANGCRDVVIETSTFDNCNRNGVSVIFGNTILINDNTFRNLSGNPGAGVDIEPNAGDIVTNVKVSGNRSINCEIGFEAYALAAGSQIVDSVFSGNKASECVKGMLLNSVTDFTAESNLIYRASETGVVLESTTRLSFKGNEIVDCNTSNAGFMGLHLFSGNQNADISENKITVSVTSQYQLYNVYESSTGNSNNVVRNNILSPFRTAGFFIGGTNTVDTMNQRYDNVPNSSQLKIGNRTFRSANTASGAGIAGDRIFNNNPTAGAAAEWVYASGNWQPVQCGVIGSIAATPSFVGQLAVVAGVGYMATGISGTGDWKQITN
jgi:hypothetical protein